MIIPNKWKNKKCSKPPSSYIASRTIPVTSTTRGDTLLAFLRTCSQVLQHPTLWRPSPACTTHAAAGSNYAASSAAIVVHGRCHRLSSFLFLGLVLSLACLRLFRFFSLFLVFPSLGFWFGRALGQGFGLGCRLLRWGSL